MALLALRGGRMTPAPVALRPPRVDLDDDGKPIRAFVPSKTRPGVEYELERSMSGRWHHIDATCRGWVDAGRCYHITALEGLMDEHEETRSLTVQLSPLALLDAVQLEDIMNEKLVPSSSHIYSFRMKGKTVEGVSIDGVRDASRALSTKGEAIRELWVRTEREDEREAYFVACSARFAVAPDGREICMDTAIRARRQPKYAKHADGSGEYFVEKWFEIGVASAARNATEALLPEQLKEFIKDKARALLPENGQRQAPRQEAPRQQVPRPQASQPQRPPQAQQQQQQPRGDEPKPLPAQLRGLLMRMSTEIDKETATAALNSILVDCPEAKGANGAILIAKMTPEQQQAAVTLIREVLDGESPDPADEAYA